MSTLECPSGLVGEVRKIRGAELVRLAEDADARSSSGGFAHVLEGCWVATVDPGPYPNLEDKPRWDRLLKGDYVYAFVMLRALSLGDDYDFDVRCEECGHKIKWSVRLSDLPVQRLPEESTEVLRAHGTFTTTLADGRALKFYLATVAQEEPVLRFLKQTKRQQLTIVDRVLTQVASIEGVNPDVKAKWKYLSELDVGELYRLRDVFDSVDCGLETAIEVRCTNRACGWEQQVDLPLGRTFYAPARRTMERTASASRSTPESTWTGSEGSSTASSGTSTAAVVIPSPTGM